MDRKVFSLAWPSIVAELSTPLLGVVDTLVVGHLADVADLGGVALATAVFNPLLFVFNFLRMGTGGVTAKAYGAGDAKEVLATVLRGVGLGVAIGACLLVLGRPVAHLGLAVVRPPDAATADRALAYFRARLLGAPAALANFAIAGWLNGVQRPNDMLATSLVLNVSNAGLCVLLAWVLDFGVAGVGFATALANYIALGFGAFRIWRIYPQLQCVSDTPEDMRVMSWSVILERPSLVQLMAVQGSVFLRSLFLMCLITDFNSLSAALGAVPLAANNLLSQLQMLISYGSDGFANAAEALVGEAVGQGRLDLVRAVLVSVARWSAVVVLGYTAVYVFFGQRILECFTSHKAVVIYAVEYLPWLWAAPVLSVAAYMLDGVFVGANCYREMRDANFWAMVAFLILGHCLRHSNSGLWAAYLAHLVIRAAVLLWKYPAIEQQAVEHAAGGTKAALLAADGTNP